jgi:dimethylhistidine N-methyltransferase
VEELIRAGLSKRQKELPSLLLYDTLGSRLFEAITALPEYGVAAAAMRLIDRHAREVVAGGPYDLIELGPGSGRMARRLIEALRQRQAQVRFVGIDVSKQALGDCRRALSDVAAVVAIESTYLEGLATVPKDQRALVLFLGSNLSNFDRGDARAFLRGIRERLRPRDALLLAVDLDKEPERLLPAYDDALGVTAAFNRNVLVRLNREFGADFTLSAFRHEARWNAAERRIEMHLKARKRCEARVLGLAVRLEEGETIWTESSHRFSLAELRTWALEAGFAVAKEWVDAEWPFAQLLLTCEDRAE